MVFFCAWTSYTWSVMVRKRRQRTPGRHLVVLVNTQARRYSAAAVKRLLQAIKAKGGSYSIFEPETAQDTLFQALVAVGKRKASQRHPAPFERGGPVTGLVACGGDSTFNLVARAAAEADLPMGCLPMGRINNIARSLKGELKSDECINRIVEGKYRQIDMGYVADLPFVGSMGIGFMTRLLGQLGDKPLPRSGLSWSKAASRAAADVPAKKMLVKVDSFRFEIRPLMLQVNLLPIVCGLPFTPASLPDDGCAEIIFDPDPDAGHFSSYVRLISKGKYLYGNEIRLYRGSHVLCQLVKGRQLFLDGEVTEITKDILEIKVEQNKLRRLLLIPRCARSASPHFSWHC